MDDMSDEKRGWSTSETAMLMDAWGKAESIYALAHALGRTRMAVLVYATRLGLPARTSSGVGKKRWTEEELKLLDDHYGDVLSGKRQSIDIEFLVSKFERSFDAILAKIEKRWGSDAIDMVDPSAFKGRDGLNLPEGIGSGLLKVKTNSPMANVTIPVTEKKKTGPQQRKCLSCGVLFWSEGPHNRICNMCKTTKAWWW